MISLNKTLTFSLSLISLLGIATHASAEPPANTYSGYSSSVENRSQYSKASPWKEAESERDRSYKRYIRDHMDEYEWFANFANSYSGVPFVLLRIFPELAPEIWGKPEEDFASFGFDRDVDDPKRPLPRGLGWTSVDRKAASEYDVKKPSLHVVSLTCGACHIGRVRTADGRYLDLVGAPNTQIDARKWRRAFELTVDKYMKDDETIAQTAERLLEVISKKPPTYFYNNYRNFGAEAEKSQLSFFSKKENLEAMLRDFAGKVRVGRLAILKQMATSYAKNGPPLDGGSPGQSDGSGDLIPKLLLQEYLAGAKSPAEVQEKLHAFTTTEFPALPKNLATVTDIVSVWNQSEKPLAQIDGSVKSPFFRNIAAIVAISVDPKAANYINADFSARFTHKLPSLPYPFDVDSEKAERGAKLFKDNCAVCHRSQNATLYQTMETDFNRARVLNDAAFELFGRNFRAAVPPGYTIVDPEGRKLEPATLPIEDILIARTTPETQGYVTDNLAGLWARAPYLHNGSVPTLRHLLAPDNEDSKRPMKFVRGAISYDERNVGFVWDSARFNEYRQQDAPAALFDASLDGQSNGGHHRDAMVDGSLRRLNWSGPQNRAALDDLLEYLKTL